MNTSKNLLGGRLLGLTIFTLFLLLGLASLPVVSARAQCRTYTIDADFDQGVLDGVNHDPPNGNQLQLSPQASTFRFAWIANSGEGTVSKVDTETGKEVARYYTGPLIGSPANQSPSRTAIDRDGNCWVANRNPSGKGSITQILIEGGVDRNGNGSIETSMDANNNGIIEPGEMLPWGSDERVARHYRVGGANGYTRALTLDKEGFVWVGLWNEQRILKLDPNLSVITYAPLAAAQPPELATVSTAPSGTYGLATGPNAMLYLATLSSTVKEIDPGAASGGSDPPRVLQSLSTGGTTYGIAVDRDGIVWMGNLSQNRCIRWDPAQGAAGFSYGVGAASTSRGITVDFDGNIWIACDQANQVAKYAPTNPPTLLFNVPAGGAIFPIGVGTAADGNIIVVGYNSNSWGKIDKTTGATIATGGPQSVGLSPYTYSDFTGSLSRIIGRQGFWTVVFDGGSPGVEWGRVCWTSNEPETTAVSVEVRAADAVADLPNQTYTAVGNCVDFSALYGKYIQVKVRFTSDRHDLVTPVLYDLTVCTANGAPVIVCPRPVYPPDVCEKTAPGEPPEIETSFNLGDLVALDATSSDPDGDALTYSFVSITKILGAPGVNHNTPTIDSDGHILWQLSAADTAEVGTWSLCFAVSDGRAADTCCFELNVTFEPYVVIRDVTGTSDKIYALNGTVDSVFVRIGPDYPLGGLDLLLAYDQTAIQFVQPAVALLDLAEWEYFTYRTGYNGNCGDGCPSGIIRIIAIADLDNGPTHHPLPSEFGLEGNVIKLYFRVTADRNYIGQCIPIYFYWVDCGDNALASRDGEALFVIDEMIPDTCLSHPKPGHPVFPILDFCDGWICVLEPPDDRGDINLNGVANEIGDAVLFSNFFIYGIDATFAPPGDRREAQKLATDVNDDGIVLTVADLVYLIRIITGDAQPFPKGENPKLTPYQQQAGAIINVGADRVTVTANSPVDLGGAVFTFGYSGLTVGTPVLSNAASQMVMKSNAERGELRVLVAPMMDVKGARIGSGLSEILSIPTEGQGTIELVDVQMSDAQGNLLTTSAGKSVPTEYTLLQNYPNPFNAGTIIQFSLKDQTDWTLNVYNITGQTVRSFAGNGAGLVQVAWNGTDNAGNAIASGLYFYRLETKAFTATKKMTLMK